MSMGVVHDDGRPRLGPDGNPVLVMVFFPPDEATIIEDWDTLGIRGTGRW